MPKITVSRLHLIVLLRYSYQAFTGEYISLCDAKYVVDAYWAIARGEGPVLNGYEMDNFFKFCVQALKTQHLMKHA